MVRWGLVPYWADDVKIGNRLINARAETIERTPAFRDAYQRRRCLVPADGFFEWRKAGKAATAVAGPAPGPGAVRLCRPVGALAAAGRQHPALLHDRHLPAERAGRAGHDRMPVILAPDDHERWLDPQLDGRELLRPCPGRVAGGYPGKPEGQQPGQRRSRMHCPARGPLPSSSACSERARFQATSAHCHSLANWPQLACHETVIGRSGHEGSWSEGAAPHASRSIQREHVMNNQNEVRVPAAPSNRVLQAGDRAQAPRRAGGAEGDLRGPGDQRQGDRPRQQQAARERLLRHRRSAAARARPRVSGAQGRPQISCRR